MTVDTTHLAGDKTAFAAAWQQMRRDRLLHLLLTVLVVSSIPLFLPALSLEQQTTYGWLHSTFVLLPMTILLFWPLTHHSMGDAERKMWKVLSLGWGFWWFASCFNTLLNLGVSGFDHKFNSLLDFNIDYLYLGYFISWLVALGNRPHDVTGRQVQCHQWLQMGGSIGLAICMFLYFILIPSQFSPVTYDTWVPSFLFYAGLDLFLIMVLISLLLHTKSQRWKFVYGALMISLLLLTWADVKAALDEQSRHAWAGHPLMDVLWISPFVFLVLAARFRGYVFPEPSQTAARPQSSLEYSRLLGSPLVLTAIFLLVMHVVLELMGLVEPQLRPLQGLVVIFALMMFLMLAVIENKSLRELAEVASQREQELEQLRIEHAVEQQSQQAKNQFLANVSHELRTPMNGILGMTELMLHSDLPMDQRKRASLVYTSAENLLKTIDDILEYSKLDEHEIILLQEEFNIEQLAEQVLGLKRGEADQKNISLQLEVEPEVPRCLSGDGARLQQVLMNIVSNAIKFTAAGEVQVRFALAGKASNSARIRCEVIDTGIGLAPGVERKLFLPFSQGDASTSRRFGGSGLGLAICRQVVEAQGGRIGAFANPVVGATFWFEIDYRYCGSPSG
jgi:signal transduction histidine kinase